MPGLVGYCCYSNDREGLDLLPRMARALEPEDRFKIDLYQEPSLGLGRVTLGIANPGPQPIWNEEKTVCVMMEGELYDYQISKRNLIERGHHFQVHSDVEYLLHLYEEYGDDFAIKLNGAFIAIIWDKNRRRLLLVNDRLGLYPCYYAQTKDFLLFGSGVRALLAEPTLSRQIDQIAIAEFLTFDHVLHDHTLLKAVRLLPQASLLSFSEQGLEIRPYWRVCHPDTYLLRSEVELMEEFLFLVKQAVTRQKVHDNLPAAILLSGGLDSRLLLAYLVENDDEAMIRSFTWGVPGCDDLRFARQISRLLGSQHHFFELKPDWLLHRAEEAVRITDGMGNLINLHALATLEAESEITQILYKGFLGDAMMGFGIRHQFWSNYDATTTTSAHIQVHRDQGVITFDPMFDHQNLFTQAFQKEISTGVMDNYTRGMRDAQAPYLAQQRIYFDYYQRVPRMTIKGVEVARSRTIVRLPFGDNDLVEFSLTVPPGLLYQRRLMKNAFIKAFPKLAQVPVTETNLPMMSCMRDVVMRASEVIRWHLNARGFSLISQNTKRPYSDYNNWFRGVLRGWVENILLSEQCLQRGYFNSDYLKKTVDEHMQGANHKVKLGALLSLELWHRQFIDS